MKTDAKGQYEFFTLKPGIYPDRGAPAHIHPVILEPDGKYYWVEDYYFADDELLTANERSPQRPRGGTHGVLNLKKRGELWEGTRHFILGKNVAAYPASTK